MTGNIDIVNRYYDAINRHDWDAAAQVVDARCVLRTPGGTAEGREAVLGFDRMWAVATPDFKVTPLRQIGSDDDVASENNFKGTHQGILRTPGGEVPPTGRKLDAQYVGLFKVRGGKIVSQSVYFDQVELMTQLGLMPPPKG